MAKPFLKWVGGKTRLLPELHARLPVDIDQRVYCEPFLGGGAMFFSGVPVADGLFAMLCDVNEDLILTYRCVKHDVERVIYSLEILARKHAEKVAS